MTRKIAASLILTAVLALAILTGTPALNAASHSTMVTANRSGVVLVDEVSTPTPTPGASPNTGVSGGGNGGG